ncbi:MAG: hypothetical protein FWF41_01670 [Betaproteobacteria bacterium]|nr:hypothetical protein [Betaproteobacteria bacterium]
MLTVFRSAVSVIVTAFALLLALPAHADYIVDYTDIWIDANAAIGAAGFGINFVQSGNSFDYIFATFFIYDPATGNPVWVTGGLSRDSSGTYFSGDIYQTKSDPTTSPFLPKNAVSTKLGTAKFTPTSTNSTTGTLVYTVNGTATTINLKRQTLTENILDGTYWGQATIRSANCSSSIYNGTFFNTMVLTVAKQANSSQATYTFTLNNNSYNCTMTGTLVQEGRFQKIDNAKYVCYSGNTKIVDSSANLYNIAATTQGIEGEWTSDKGWGSCVEETHFAAVLYP